MKKLILIWICVMWKSVDALAKFAAFNNFYCSFAKIVSAKVSSAFFRRSCSLESDRVPIIVVFGFYNFTIFSK